MVGTVVMTDEAERWLLSLNEEDEEGMMKALDALRMHGPMLRRPMADRVRSSRHHHMKELRSVGGHLRALYAFDPRPRAIILLGGDKSGDWTGWYERNVPRADALYDEFLHKVDQEGESR